MKTYNNTRIDLFQQRLIIQLFIIAPALKLSFWQNFLSALGKCNIDFYYIQSAFENIVHTTNGSFTLISSPKKIIYQAIILGVNFFLFSTGINWTISSKGLVSSRDLKLLYSAMTAPIVRQAPRLA